MRSLCRPLQSFRSSHLARIPSLNKATHCACLIGKLNNSTRRLESNLPCLTAKRRHGSQLKNRKTSTFSAHDDSTIYALSTAPGRAAIAIIRVSGPACLTVYQSLCPDKAPPKPRYASLRTLYEPGVVKSEARVLDSGALVLFFPSPETVTGEDVLEFHVHGGTAVVKAVLAAIPKAISKDNSQSIRYAEPGEFTRRAFYNNRLDLLQIEALGDTLAAETERQRRLAVRGTASIVAERYESWRKKLLYARGELEALIDFSEDQQFDESPASLCASVAAQVQGLKSQLQTNIANGFRGELLRNGIRIALVGAPNVGKSSLLNEIVGRQAAIVSSEPGTTRDVIDVNVDIGGYYCRISDLAGLRKESATPGTSRIGEIEEEGMRRAKQLALTADVVIAVCPIVRGQSLANESSSRPRVTAAVDDQVLAVLKQCDPQTQNIVFVLNKSDFLADDLNRVNQISDFKQLPVIKDIRAESETVYAISCKDAQNKSSENPDAGGIQALLDGLTQLFGKMTSAMDVNGQQVHGDNSAWAESLGATERQRTLLEQCLRHLESFLAEVGPSQKTQGMIPHETGDIDVVVAAENLRAAADCLARISGRGDFGDVEEVLGVVFEK